MVYRSLSKQDGVLFGRHSELGVEGVVPDLLHVVPVGHEPALNGVFDLEDAALVLGLLSHVDLFLVQTDHNAGHLGSAHHRGEN